MKNRDQPKSGARNKLRSPSTLLMALAVTGMITGAIVGYGLATVVGTPERFRSPGDPLGVTYAEEIGIFVGLLSGFAVYQFIRWANRRVSQSEQLQDKEQSTDNEA